MHIFQIAPVRHTWCVSLSVVGVLLSPSKSDPTGRQLVLLAMSVLDNINIPSLITDLRCGMHLTSLLWGFLTRSMAWILVTTRRVVSP